jgi:hypothetical protein
MAKSRRGSQNEHLGNFPDFPVRFLRPSRGHDCCNRFGRPLLHVSTDVGPGFIDEVMHAGVACQNGPAYLELCDPLAGKPVCP